MGCGHSKISIYPKKARSKNNCKKTVTSDKAESEEEESVENESEVSEKLEDCDQRKTIKVKPFGGPLLAQSEISSSQQNFFRMLDEKIENGPDYDSASEAERAAEAARLDALLRDWETASAGSRSLPATPRRRARPPHDGAAAARSADAPVRTYCPQISQSVVHQSYGVVSQQQQQQFAYRQNVGYAYQGHPVAVYPSALQYQALSPMYNSQPTYQPPVRQYYPAANSPKHHAYDHKGGYSNGELIQQQVYGHQLQYQQAREYQQYRQTREQMLIHQQQQQHQQGGYAATRSYQSTVHIPIVVQSELSPMHRKQYEPT